MNFGILAFVLTYVSFIENISCYLYPNASMLHDAVLDICCGIEPSYSGTSSLAWRGKRNIGESMNRTSNSYKGDDDDADKIQNIRSFTTRDARSFLSRIRSRRGLHEECCQEGCDYEETCEGQHGTLQEECMHEGCSYGEISADCF